MPHETAEDRAAQARNRPEDTANREHAMRNVNPFVGLFVAMATLMAAFFVPVFVLLIDHGERLAAVEATVAAMRVEHGERMTEYGARLARVEARFEARMDALEARMDDLEAAIAALARDVAATNERMARIEGTVAGALGRPFPERMAEGPDNPGAEG